MYGVMVYSMVSKTHNVKYTVPWRLVPRPFVLVTIRPKRSSPMDRHLAPPISGSWSPGAARAVDGASLLHGPLRVDRNAETEKKLNGWTKGRGNKRQGTQIYHRVLLNDANTEATWNGDISAKSLQCVKIYCGAWVHQRDL